MSTRDEDLLARVAWAQIAEPGDRAAAALIHASGAAEALDRLASIDAQIKRRVVNASYAPLAEEWLSRHGGTDRARRAVDEALAAGLVPIIPGDEHWPARLADIERADPLAPAQPLMLWARGDVSLLAAQNVAITGARACTGYGAHVTAEIARHVAEHGVTVISGAAYGVDAAAHRAALAADGKTVAVLASGADRVYPAGHRELIERIAHDGCAVSEALPGTAPTRQRFLMRARLLAALASAVVIPEAGTRSGSLRVAEQAHSMGRPVGAVPGPVTSAVSAGCHLLVQQGAARLLVDGEEALALLGPCRSPQSTHSRMRARSTA